MECWHLTNNRPKILALGNAGTAAKGYHHLDVRMGENAGAQQECRDLKGEMLATSASIWTLEWVKMLALNKNAGI
jgi:hypothetical protein